MNSFLSQIISPDSFFINEQAKSKYQNYCSRPIVIPKYISDEYLFEKHGILDVFDFQNWRSLLIFNTPCFPILVRQFYANLSVFPETLELTSFVKGKFIRIDEQSLSQILEIPTEGWTFQSIDGWSTEPFTPLRQTQIVLNDDDLTTAFVPQKLKLPPFSSIIHLFCTRNIFPTDLRVKAPDMFLISMLLSKQKINLPKSMIFHMALVHGENFPLPYAGLLTRIFSFNEIDVSLEESVPSEPFTDTALLRISYPILNIAPKIRASTSSDKRKLTDEQNNERVLPPVPLFASTSTSHNIEDLYVMVSGLKEDFTQFKQEISNQLQLIHQQQEQSNKTLNEVLDIFRNKTLNELLAL